MEGLSTVNHFHLGLDISKLNIFKALDVIYNPDGITSKPRYSDSLDYLRTQFKKRIDNAPMSNNDEESASQKRTMKRKLFSIRSRYELNKCDFVHCLSPLLEQEIRKISKTEDILKWYSEKLVATKFVVPTKIVKLEISFYSSAVYAGSTFYRSRGEFTSDRNQLKFQMYFKEWCQMEVSSDHVKSVTIYSKCPFIKISVRTKIVDEINNLCAKYLPSDTDIIQINPKKSSERYDVIIIFTNKILSKTDHEQLIDVFGKDRVLWNESDTDGKQLLENVFYKHPYLSEIINNITRPNWSLIFKKQTKLYNVRKSEVVKTKPKTEIISPIAAIKSHLSASTSDGNNKVTGLAIPATIKFDSSPNIFQKMQQEPPLINDNDSQTPSVVNPNIVIASINQLMNNGPKSSLPDFVDADTSAKTTCNITNNSTKTVSQTNSLYYIPQRNLANVFNTFHYTPSPDCDVLIHGCDLLCLNNGQYLNDSIISFYLNFIRYEIMSEDQRRRTHLFNIFFNTKLRGTPSTTAPDTPESRHARVSKWTKKVDIFDKDFLIIPFNEKLHWFVAIVCFPWMAGMISYDKLLGINPVQTLSEIPANESVFATSARQTRVNHLRNEYGIEPKPCILLFDSLQFESRAPNVRLIREYLKTEWDCKRRASDGPLVFDKNTIRGFNPQVPRQTNHTDCGIFVLHYVEQFFAQPPKVFTKEFFQSSLLSWFKDETVARKRATIQRMVLRKADEQRAMLATTSGDGKESEKDSCNHEESPGPDIEMM